MEKGRPDAAFLPPVAPFRPPKLLDETELTVREISTQCGYDETTNFFRNFKRSEGVTPTEYRQKSKVPDPAISNGTCQENSLYRA